MKVLSSTFIYLCLLFGEFYLRERGGVARRHLPRQLPVKTGRWQVRDESAASHNCQYIVLLLYILLLLILYKYI
jgi:hypothetical protein